jgi:TolA-binding protein
MIRAAIVLLIALLASPGCRATMTGPEQKQPAVQPLPSAIDDARRLIRDRQYPDALARLETALQQGGNADGAAEARYLIATVHVAADNPQRNYAQAIAEFDAFLDRYPDHARAPEARSWRLAIKTVLETRKENERLHRTIEDLKQLDVKKEEQRLMR